jgi:hypothetical protein
MQSTTTPASPIPVPDVDTDRPVTVIPAASVAPLEGPPDGERINIFALVPADKGRELEDILGESRDRVIGKPLTYLAAAFALGLFIGRVLR